MPDPLRDPDAPHESRAALVPEPCLLAEDLITISLREPGAWLRFASTAEHSMGQADWDLPFLVVRTHTEVVDGEELMFALVAMRSEVDDHPGALFGEFACSPALFAELVKEFGLPRPLPRTASEPIEDLPSPAELDAHAWAQLLGGEEEGGD